MKIINEKGKLFGIINLVDLLVLVFILLVVGGVAWKIFGSQVTRIVANDFEITYTVRMQNTYKEYYDELVKNGFPQQLTAGDGYVDGAYITGAVMVPAVNQVPNSLGQIVDFAEQTRIDIICTITAKTADTAIIKVGTQEIRVGKDHFVKTKYFEMTGTIESSSFSTGS